MARFLSALADAVPAATRNCPTRGSVIGAPCTHSLQTPFERAQFVSTIDNALPFFKGHFPGQPILPGIVTLQGFMDVAGAHVVALLQSEKGVSCASGGCVESVRESESTCDIPTTTTETTTTVTSATTSASTVASESPHNAHVTKTRVDAHDCVFDMSLAEIVTSRFLAPVVPHNTVRFDVAVSGLDVNTLNSLCAGEGCGSESVELLVSGRASLVSDSASGSGESEEKLATQAEMRVVVRCA